MLRAKLLAIAMPALPAGQDEGATREPLRAAALLCVAFAGLVGILLGYDMGIVSAALLPIQQHFSLTDFQAELFVGFLSLFALPGCVLGSALADNTGRRAGIGIAAALFLAGNVLMASAWSYTVLLTGRGIAGFAMGLTYVLAPLYVAEVSPSRLRGMLTSLLEVLSNVGILLGYTSGWACDGLPGSMDWRLMLGLGVIPPLAILVGTCCMMLESPRWLAAQGRMDEAEEVLHRVVGPAEAKAAILELRSPDLGTAAAGSSAGFTEIMAAPGLMRTIFIGVGVAFFSQATGCEAVMYYSGSILEHAGISRGYMLRAAVLMGCVKTGAVLASGALVDRWGRRPLLMLSSSGMCLSMLVLSAAGHWHWPPVTEVAALCAFVVAFSTGFGPVVYVYNSEIYPQQFRSTGLGLAMGVCRVMSAVVSATFLSLAHWLTTSGALVLYSGVAASGTIFVLTCVPETKGTTLETSTSIFARGTSS